MIFDALTYSILTMGAIVTFAVIRLTIINNRLTTNDKGHRDD